MSEQLLLEILLGEFREKLDRVKNLVPRAAKFPEAPDKIKVAMGIRRSGKTYFIFQQIMKLLNEGVSLTEVLYINFEDDRLEPLDKRKLANLVDSFYLLYPENHERKCYLFFDEIQNVDDWASVIRRFHDTKNAEIYLTGSSAKLLSKEIATNLRGRSIPTEIWPYSFHEFMRAKNRTIDKSLYDSKTKDQLVFLFNEYLSEGGFPEVIRYEADVRQQVLQEYADIVLYRDIIERHEIKNPALIKHMMFSMIHNVSNPFSINKFFNEVKGRGYKTGKDHLYEYAEHIEDAYLAFSISLDDQSIRKSQTNPKKIYAIDPGLVRALTLDYEGDLGKLFENIIYLDLRRLGCRVSYYLTRERYEIDFVAKTPQGKKKFFQIVGDDRDEKTKRREERALKAAASEAGIEGEIITLESYLRKGISLP